MEYRRRDVAAWAAIALAIPTARTLTIKNAVDQPLSDAALTSRKNALPTSSSAKEARPAASALASQVCRMKQKATITRPIIIAMPAEFRLPVDSSAIVEMPSKPSKLRTAIESAGARSGPVILAGSQTGCVVTSAPGIVPAVSAVTEIMTKMTTNTSLIVKNTRFISLSEVMPARFTTVLIATKMSAQIQRGVPGNIPTMDSAAKT